MKIRHSIAATIAAAGLTLAGCATQSPPAPEVDSDATLTGSRVITPVTVQSVNADGPQRVRMIDREEIERTGATSIEEVLRLTGQNR